MRLPIIVKNLGSSLFSGGLIMRSIFVLLIIKNYIFYDFGSGYGKIVNYFSNYCLESIGIEIDKERYEKSLQYKSDNIHFLNFDFLFISKLISP